jgi:hypothetical protein
VLDLPVIVSMFRCFVSIDYIKNDCAFENFMLEKWFKENETKLLFRDKINEIHYLLSEGTVYQLLRLRCLLESDNRIAISSFPFFIVFMRQNNDKDILWSHWTHNMSPKSVGFKA